MSISQTQTMETGQKLNERAPQGKLRATAYKRPKSGDTRLIGNMAVTVDLNNVPQIRLAFVSLQKNALIFFDMGATVINVSYQSPENIDSDRANLITTWKMDMDNGPERLREIRARIRAERAALAL